MSDQLKSPADATGQNFFRKCSSCKKEIAFGKIYYQCEVSTCHKQGFCSVDCWNLHNEIMNHRNAGAMEKRAPFEPLSDAPREARRIIVTAPKADTSGAHAPSPSTSMDEEILVVASKLKAYVKEKYDLSTSANVMDKLSDIIRLEADKASRKAISEGRKTLMDRDF